MKRTPKNGENGSRQTYLNTKKFDPNKYKLEKERVSREVIQNMSNLCCRRCCEIISWKVDYGKYEPLRQSRKCNICGEKSVNLAYHRICQECAKNNGVCAKCQKNPLSAYTIGFQGNRSEDNRDFGHPDFLRKSSVTSCKYDFVDDVLHPELERLKGLDTRALAKQLNEEKLVEESTKIQRLRERERRTVLRNYAIGDLDTESD